MQVFLERSGGVAGPMGWWPPMGLFHGWVAVGIGVGIGIGIEVADSQSDTDPDTDGVSAEWD
jgi:hypothetical protein